MIHTLTVRGYRSLEDVTIPFTPATILVGPNGCGKTNLYQALRLVQHAVNGSLARALADEGGIPSVLWAGQRKKGAVRLVIEVGLDDFTYSLALGLPQDGGAFALDPEVKEETLGIAVPKRKRPLLLVDRHSGSAMLRDEEGLEQRFPYQLDISESVVSQVSDPRRFPELFLLRQLVAKWRFVHQFRTDAEAPARRPAIAVRTQVLADDGGDLPCAVQTLRENGDGPLLDEAIGLAFPGASVSVVRERGTMEIAWAAPGLLRPLAARELSDGTLRFLCLATALLSGRPPPLLALNEPETSLHPSMLPALAKLCAHAAPRTQLWVTTHSEPLAQALSELAGASLVRLSTAGGSTTVA